MDSDPHSSHGEHRTPPASFHQMITPTKSSSRGLLTDLAGWPSYLDMRTQVSGNEESGRLHHQRNFTSASEPLAGRTHGLGAFQKSSHLPTPQSPGNIASYLLTRTPSSVQSLQPDLDLTVLPTEFRSHISPSPPPLRPHLIPTPECSPLVARSRNNGQSQIPRASCRQNNGTGTPSKRGGQRSRASTPPRTPSRQTSTRPVTPVSQSRPISPFQHRATETFSVDQPDDNNLHLSGLATRRIKDEPGGEAAITLQLVSTQATDLHRLHCPKRTRCLTPTSDAGAGGASDSRGKDTSLLWSSSNVVLADSPNKGKRTTLFQETSEESFEESLMAGGYGRYRSDRLSWKLDEDGDAPKQLGDAIGEDGPGSESALTEEERRKKTRLAAFLDPPRVASSASQLFPVEIEGCGRVLMMVEPPEPQSTPKPTPRTKRSRKRKKPSTDMKQDVDMDGVAVPQDRTIDGPNWPDMEFPWRSHPTQDGLSSAEREERLRYIEGFLDRDSDEDDVEEGHSSSSRHSPDENMPSRSPKPGRGKMYPLPFHSKGPRRGSTMLSIVPSDPADAKTALLSKRSIRAVQLRLLRRRNADRSSEDGETLCICQGWDDGRPLVQCDACQTWYHLECIGIRNASELGKEEDPWFCANCGEVKTPPPVATPMSEPTFVSLDDGEHGVGKHCGTDPGGHNRLFLNAGFNPSPATQWTRSAGGPSTPPRTQSATHAPSGGSWEEAPSSSSRGGPRTPRFETASAFGDMVRVYGMTPGHLLEPSSSTTIDEASFDPTSTPSRGIRFGLPFATPKDGRWESSSLHGVRGSGHELFHTPKRPAEDGSSRSGQPLNYHGRVEEVTHEGPSRMHGLYRAGTNNVTPIEREVLTGPRWMQGLESPLGAKRPRRTVDS